MGLTQFKRKFHVCIKDELVTQELARVLFRLVTVPSRSIFSLSPWINIYRYFLQPLSDTIITRTVGKNPKKKSCYWSFLLPSRGNFIKSWVVSVITLGIPKSIGSVRSTQPLGVHLIPFLSTNSPNFGANFRSVHHIPICFWDSTSSTYKCSFVLV